MSYLKGLRPSGSMIVAIIALIVACAGTAVAAATITSKDIVNGAVSSKKVKDKSLKSKDLSKKTKKQLKGRKGPKGPQGPRGPQGPAGPPGGDAGFSGEMWGVIERNSFGSPAADLRLGPWGINTSNGQPVMPPFGDGALGLRVDENGGDNEAVTFGAEFEFGGLRIADIDEIGYSAFYGDSTSEMTNIKFEVDPNTGAANYSTLNHLAGDEAEYPRATWFEIDASVDDPDVSGDGWYFTNASAATESGCTLADPCSLDELKAGAPSAVVTLSGGIGFGRGGSFVGAVDGFQVNDEVYDFEQTGTEVTTAP